MAGTSYGGHANVPNFSIKTIWAIAKSKELSMSEEDLRALMYRETGKDSMKLLTQQEINRICLRLNDMKDGITGRKTSKQKRTDTGGTRGTENQRKLIYKLTEELGWNDNNNRINGLVKKMFRVDRIEWLENWQCSKLIEALKQMKERKTDA